MGSAIDSFLSGLKGSGAANGAALYTQLLEERDLTLPGDLRQVLMSYDGGVARVDGHYLHLWKSTELVELNEAYSVDEFAPGLLLFGSDGGDTAYGFRKVDGKTVLVAVPFVGMDVSEAKILGDTFETFLQSLIGG